MSFSEANGVIAVKGRGLKFDGYSLEVHPYTKLTGDTTGTVVAGALRRIDKVVVLAADGTVIAAGVTIDNTQNQSGHKGLASAALTSLGAGTSGVIVLKGSKR